MKKQYSHDFKQQIIEEIKSGEPIATVARKYEVPISTVAGWYKEYKKEQIAITPKRPMYDWRELSFRLIALIFVVILIYSIKRLFVLSDHLVESNGGITALESIAVSLLLSDFIRREIIHTRKDVLPIKDDNTQNSSSPNWKDLIYVFTTIAGSMLLWIGVIYTIKRLNIQ